MRERMKIDTNEILFMNFLLWEIAVQVIDRTLVDDGGVFWFDLFFANRAVDVVHVRLLS